MPNNSIFNNKKVPFLVFSLSISYSIRIIIIIFVFLGHAAMTYGQVIKDTSLVLFSKNIYFENAQSTLDTNNRKSLLAFVDSLQKIKSKFFSLEGHTNNIGSEASNLSLSLARVRHIKNILIDNKIDSNTIQSIGLGKSKPEWSNKDKEGQVLNRQVKIKVFKKFSLRKIKGKSLDSLLSIKNVLIIARNQFFSDSTYTKDDGSFELFVPEKIPTYITANKKEYLSDMIEVVADESSKEIIVAMLPIRLQKSIKILSINFVGNKCIILPKSLQAIEHLRDQIKLNTDFCFEIQGHVNAPNQIATQTLAYMNLSKARAGFLYNYLAESNVAKERMFCTGFGATLMLNPKATTEKEMVANRRVEIKVYDCNAVKERRASFNEKEFINLSKSKLHAVMEY
jgi:outer membrane protein OmpA-like peptidoglycan-associated protein